MEDNSGFVGCEISWTSFKRRNLTFLVTIFAFCVARSKQEGSYYVQYFGIFYYVCCIYLTCIFISDYIL